jgi:transposase
VGRGTIEYRMGRESGGYGINDPILKSRLGYWQEKRKNFKRIKKRGKEAFEKKERKYGLKIS